ncbi:BED-type domain-containing protein [Citrus sinensis]|uniref:BED-type domain-containing protein n=1 Tax=Citrus sinensis TaxID=2711 RepID=A0ACB8L9N9_CITSI|nr:BED-type domain-containing protein [Citrus sinensis]
MENVSESSNLPSNPSVESENVQEEMQSDKKRKQRVVSNCWDHFTKLNVGSVAKAKCNHCGTVLSCGSGTSHLNRHTRQIHGFNQPTIEEVFENKQHLVKTESGELGIQKFDPLVARQKLTTVVVKHELPLRFVEYESFRDFVDYCNPLVKHMSINTLKSEIFKIYNIEEGKAMNLLEITNSRVAITTDMWTACNQKKGYMVVTGHFIDNSWHLQSRILRFIYVQAPHIADCISQILVKCLMDWNLDRKLSTVTLDNCSTNDAMVARLKGLLSTESMILSDSVSYWSSSPKWVEKFELACRQIQIDVKKLGLDCPTRWNSTFAMLELAVKYKSVFSRLQTLEPQYKCLPSSEEWELAKQMLDYLRPFSKLTEMFSGTTYPTANLFFPLVCKMRIALKGWQTSDVPAVKNMADNMIGKFLKYWDEISGVLVMAVILYPRYKMMLINYYYPKIYVVGLENQLKRVRELCDEMMNYYEAKSATTRYGVVGESSTALVVPSDQSHIDFDDIDDMGYFDAYATQNSQPISSKSDLDRYLKDPLVKRIPDFDVLQWWKMNKGKYPILVEMAKDLLAIPVTTVASKSVFTSSSKQFKNICVLSGFHYGKYKEFVQAAVDLGRVIAERKLHLVYGGGERGLSRLISEAVFTRGSQVLGIIPKPMKPLVCIFGPPIGEELVVSIYTPEPDPQTVALNWSTNDGNDNSSSWGEGIVDNCGMS